MVLNTRKGAEWNTMIPFGERTGEMEVYIEGCLEWIPTKY